ncbi:ion channel TACAN-like isoform X2 [Acipenser ruthenus]|uniref:ion channel TACAN-like isoform X2 n=1 Tax=Acipenser ruthenus TaxID=7906 RepID=UPI00145A70F6|nr:ion channel TACAN-like isoform X2 [Acipenser ruthenus]
MSMTSNFADCLRDWEDLEKDYQHIQETQRLYREKLDEVARLQTSCSGAISRQKKQLRQLSQALRTYKDSASGAEVCAIDEIQAQINNRPNTFFEMEAFLPKKNGLYLRLVLGNVNVTLLSKQAKFAYKDEYEKFKLCLTIIILVFSFSLRFLMSTRALDAAFSFLLVWYYCTLTVRESILISNGSRIKGWWVVHHYVSAFLSGVMLTWPNGTFYQQFRNPYLAYCLYQKGFQSWMWRGLTFLLPFLFFGHFWQLYNGLLLFQLTRHPDCKEWQVLMCGLSFMVLFLGNFCTTLAVVKQKFQSKKK